MFVRLCESFVENLGNLLRVALVVGGIILVQELQLFRELLLPASDEGVPESIVAEDATPAPQPDAEEEAWFSEGVRHALNCTHTEYRNAHFDECVEEPSDVYERPRADPDDIGYIDHGDVVLYASLDESASPD